LFDLVGDGGFEFIQELLKVKQNPLGSLYMPFAGNTNFCPEFNCTDAR
jgi:hypothetical protein